jgi:hypothetical protein
VWLLHPALFHQLPSSTLSQEVLTGQLVVCCGAVGNLRSEDYSLLIKSQLIGAPIGYWIGEKACTFQQCDF